MEISFSLKKKYDVYVNSMTPCIHTFQVFTPLVENNHALSSSSSLCRIKIRRRRWHPTPVLLPGKSHGQRSLVGCSPWGREEWDTTERLHFHFPALEKEMATTPVFLPGESQGQGSLMGCRLWGRTESDTTEAT